MSLTNYSSLSLVSQPNTSVWFQYGEESSKPGVNKSTPFYNSTVLKDLDVVAKMNITEMVLDRRDLPVTKVGEVADAIVDRFLGLFSKNFKQEKDRIQPVHVIENEVLKKKEKRISQQEPYDYRSGLYFTNWPPYHFSKPTIGIGPGCQSYHNLVKQNESSAADPYLLSIRLEHTCFIYETQETCFIKHLQPFFHTSMFNATTWEEVFGGNNLSDCNSQCDLYMESQILPIKWQIVMLSYRNYSQTFIDRLLSGLEAMTECEKKEYKRQTTLFAVTVSGASLLTLGAIAWLAYYKARKRSQYVELEGA